MYCKSINISVSLSVSWGQKRAWLYLLSTHESLSISKSLCLRKKVCRSISQFILHGTCGQSNHHRVKNAKPRQVGSGCIKGWEMSDKIQKAQLPASSTTMVGSLNHNHDLSSKCEKYSFECWRTSFSWTLLGAIPSFCCCSCGVKFFLEQSTTLNITCRCWFTQVITVLIMNQFHPSTSFLKWCTELPCRVRISWRSRVALLLCSAICLHCGLSTIQGEGPQHVQGASGANPACDIH